MDQEGAVGLEHQESNSLGKARSKPSCVKDFAACDEQAHGRRTVLSVPDMTARGLGARDGGPCRLVDHFELDPIGVVEEGCVIALDIVWEFLRRAFGLDALREDPLPASIYSIAC